jgi:hypothetical protein
MTSIISPAEPLFYIACNLMARSCLFAHFGDDLSHKDDVREAILSGEAFFVRDAAGVETIVVPGPGCEYSILSPAELEAARKREADQQRGLVYTPQMPGAVSRRGRS